MIGVRIWKGTLRGFVIFLIKRKYNIVKIGFLGFVGNGFRGIEVRKECSIVGIVS